MTKPPLKRCAIYTRKSSEEGLEQEFNSLHAQREACEAYIRSQKHEGWQMVKTAYDDGGISGGTMERPGLQQLLADIRDNKIDVIIVYKVDRLTRSLHDFAKMVDIFDKHGVSFVSVTQQFNTTTSMGRLTLNVLLSFAQFEREVTGERIRDKIAASKKKGIWMGGVVPLGYRVEERKLLVDPKDAALAQNIFDRYLALGCIRLLKESLDNGGVRSRTGHMFSRGGLYTLLTNPIYIGKVRHKGITYPGQHEAIIEQALWEQVQVKLAEHSNNYRKGNGKTEASLLIGKLFDASGERLTPSHAINKGRRYRYYISNSLMTGTARQNKHGWRLPAYEIEQTVMQAAKVILGDRPTIATALREAGIESCQLSRMLENTDEVSKRDDISDIITTLIKRVELGQGNMLLTLSLESVVSAPVTITRKVPMHIKRRGVELRLVIEAYGSVASRGDPSLVKAIARAWRWFQELSSGQIASITDIANREGIDKGYVSHLINLAFLSPDIIGAIIAGRQPKDLTVQALIKGIELPLKWSEQPKALGFV